MDQDNSASQAPSSANSDKQSLGADQLMVIEVRLLNEKKSIGLAYLFWFFLGYIGAHNFYLGHTQQGLVQLICCLVGLATAFIYIGFIVLVVLSLWVIADAFLIPGIIENLTQRRRTELIESMKNMA